MYTCKQSDPTFSSNSLGDVQTVDFIYLLACLSDKPTPPRNLAVTAITAETADLQWDVPDSDGGSAITHYVVEKKNVEKKTWQEVGKPNELATQVGDLHDKNQYLFRVSAANQYGVSDPVELTEPVTAKNPFSKSSALDLFFG